MVFFSAFLQLQPLRETLERERGVISGQEKAPVKADLRMMNYTFYLFKSGVSVLWEGNEMKWVSGNQYNKIILTDIL